MGRNEKSWSFPMEILNEGASAPMSIDIKVKKRYDTMAIQGSSSLCCSPEESYSPEELESIPNIVLELSSSCGSPLKNMDMIEGATILDMGSGAGLDALLCARRYPDSKVIGVDASLNMVKTARTAAAEMSLDNIEFRVGDIRKLPLRNETADVVISNCVISMFEDKSKVFSEAYRVLKPGGYLLISDTLMEKGLESPSISYTADDWEKCIVAMTPAQYESLLISSGFARVEFRDQKQVHYREGQEVISVKVMAYKSADSTNSCCC